MAVTRRKSVLKTLLYPHKICFRRPYVGKMKLAHLPKIYILPSKLFRPCSIYVVYDDTCSFLFISVVANAQLQEEARREGDAMLAAIAEHNRLEDEKNEIIRQDNLKYQQDLIGQVDFAMRQKEVEKDEDHRLYLEGLENEAQYQAKLKEALARPVIDKIHPFRKAHMEQKSGRAQSS